MGMKQSFIDWLDCVARCREGQPAGQGCIFSSERGSGPFGRLLHWPLALE